MKQRTHGTRLPNWDCFCFHLKIRRSSPSPDSGTLRRREIENLMNREEEILIFLNLCIQENRENRPFLSGKRTFYLLRKWLRISWKRRSRHQMEQGLSFNESEFKYLIVYSLANKQGPYFIFLKIQRLRNYLTLLLRSAIILLIDNYVDVFQTSLKLSWFVLQNSPSTYVTRSKQVNKSSNSLTSTTFVLWLVRLKKWFTTPIVATLWKPKLRPKSWPFWDWFSLL